jgi:L-aminopeptidase/D-esterase-like protein
MSRPRARDLGIPFDGVPGECNAITDVPGVEVGYATLVWGEGPLIVGQGPVRTGVTAVLPRGKRNADPVFAGWFSLNGNGEMTGVAWLDETGILFGPICITNTHSVGVVRDAVIGWQNRTNQSPGRFSLPVVAETCDATLNDINGFHVKPEHVEAALEGARGGRIPEGNVGGGTAMVCHGYKGGTGTASRRVSPFTVGVLVQANHGQPKRLSIAGVPVGRELAAPTIGPRPDSSRQGSIIVVVATDAPLLPHQLQRVAKRAALGVGRIGGLGENSSGDLLVAFSTGNRPPLAQDGVTQVTMVSDYLINGLFEGVVEATEEAIVNALVAAETMVGRDDICVEAIDCTRLQAVLRRFLRQTEG